MSTLTRIFRTLAGQTLSLSANYDGRPGNDGGWDGINVCMHLAGNDLSLPGGVVIMKVALSVILRQQPQTDALLLFL